jgi:CRP-like cAMP-binding protein
MRTRDSRIDGLRKVPLLSGLSKRELASILELSQEREFGPGQVIVQVGNQASDFYLLLAGRARLTVPGRKTGTLGPGDYFGEMSVLDRGPRTATIAAETRVLSLRIGRTEFLRLIDAHGSIGRKILVEMSKRVRAAERTTGTE